MKHALICALLLLSVLAYAAPMWQNDVVVRDGQDLHFYNGSSTPDSFGNVLSAWVKSTQGKHKIYAKLYQQNGSALWDNPVLVQDGIQTVQNLELHASSDNCFILSWFELGANTGSQLKLQKLSSSGLPLWGDGISVITDRIVTYYEYSLAADEQGGAYIFYKQESGNTIYGRRYNASGTELWGTNAPEIVAEPDVVFSGIASVYGYGVGLHYKSTVNQINYVERYADYGYRVWQQSYPFDNGESNLPHDIFITPDHRLIEGVKTFDTSSNNTYYKLRLYGSQGTPMPDYSYSLLMSQTALPTEYAVALDGQSLSLLCAPGGTNSELRYYFVDFYHHQAYPAGGLLMSAPNVQILRPQLSLDSTGKVYCAWLEDGANGTSLKVNCRDNNMEAAWGQGISLFSSNIGALEYSLQSSASGLMALCQLSTPEEKKLNMQVLNQQGSPLLGNEGATLATARTGYAFPVTTQPMGDRSIVFYLDENDEHEYALCYQIISADGYPVLPQPVVMGGYDTYPNYYTSCPWSGENVMVIYSLGNNSYMQLISYWGDYGLNSPGMLITDIHTDEFKLSAYENDLYLGWMQPSQSGNLRLMGQRFTNWAWAWGAGGKVLVDNILAGSSSLTASAGRYYTWQGHNPGETHNKIYGLLVDANGDPVQGWNPQGELLFDNPNDDDQRPFWATSFGESLVLVYGGFAPSQLFAQRWEPDHSQAWNMVMAEGGAWFVDCVAQDNGFGIITGSTYAGSGTVRYQFVSASGDLLHPAPGLLIANLLPYSGISQVRLAAYENGGFAAVWQNPNAHEDLELYYQTLSPQGFTVESSPQLLSHTFGDKSYPYVCSMGNEAIVVWRNMSFDLPPDYLNPFQGIFAQKLNGNIAANPDEPELPALSSFFKSCYPNPFKERVSIIWEQKNPEPVKLGVYNLKGQLVKEIFSGTKGSGEQSVTWDGANSQNKQVGSGVYFLRLHCGNKVQTRKLVKL